VNVLDYGYVIRTDAWGSDEAIIEAARMSTNKGFKGWGSPENPGDEKLLRYLWEHDHHTPFEMAGATFEVQAPIFVFRQWHRHRTQSYNEMSARYTELPDLFYQPTVERLMASSQGKKNKQGSEAGIAVEEALLMRDYYHDSALDAFHYYKLLLDHGISKEMARLVLPVSVYSRMRASANLRNWLHFLTLRLDEHAQWEIRQFALAINIILHESFPRTMELFHAYTTSRTSDSHVGSV